MEQMNIEEARGKLGPIVDRARLAGHPTVITRNGKPAAMVIPLSWYEQFKALIKDSKEVER